MMRYEEIKCDHRWEMPNKQGFQLQAVTELMHEEGIDTYLDPFPYPFKQDALEYLKSLPSNSVKCLGFDPPYSQRQLKELYDGLGFSVQMNAGYWANLKDEIARVMIKGGIVISLMWNSSGIGKSRGFAKKRIRTIGHGGMHNDTICTMEVKL